MEPDRENLSNRMAQGNSVRSNDRRRAVLGQGSIHATTGRVMRHRRPTAIATVPSDWVGNSLLPITGSAGCFGLRPIMGLRSEKRRRRGNFRVLLGGPNPGRSPAQFVPRLLFHFVRALDLPAVSRDQTRGMTGKLMKNLPAKVLAAAVLPVAAQEKTEFRLA